MKTFIPAIVGPTAVGKTEAAIYLAQHISGEIVSMDSMQIYRRMDVGTAKASKEESSAVPHYMIDIAEPDEIYTVSRYREEASAAINDILSRGNNPILAGGTGLYLDALSWKNQFGNNGADEEYRRILYCISEEENGKQKLHKMLEAVDPERALALHENDIRRIIRALEVYHSTGKAMSSQKDEREEGAFHIAVYGISMDRDAMYQRINKRVDLMIRNGLVEEVKALLDEGIKPMREGGAMQAIGYKEIVGYLDGQLSLTEAVEQIKTNSRRYAKRQWTWFRHDPRTVWFNREDYTDMETLCQAVYDRVMKDKKDYESC